VIHNTTGNKVIRRYGIGSGNSINSIWTKLINSPNFSSKIVCNFNVNYSNITSVLYCNDIMENVAH